MTISRKPKPSPPAPSVDVDALINKGGSIAQVEKPPDADSLVRVPLRTPVETLARIDQAIKARKVKVSRNIWILEALEEKLERESREGAILAP